MPDHGRGSEAPQGSQAPPSFEAFAQASQRRLYRTAYLLCGDSETARDLTQTTLAKLFQHWHRASSADHIEAYARTVLTRTYLAERRRRLRDLVAHTRPDPRPGPGDTDLRLTLISVLSELPPRARAMVVLRYWEDQSVESVAELLKCSESTVKSQCSRSLVKMRARLGEAHTYATGS
ncbi:SigE family RNA polymerase sigma factor [Streptomyces sp. NPDC005122]